MRLTTAEIDRYGPLYDCRPPCHEGLTVLSGPNEAGKTLYLEALLHLLDPAVTDFMDPAPRVNDAPTGRVVVEHNGDRFECNGEGTLTDRSPVDPVHLQTVFVVRDNDLQLPRSQEYYTSLIEKLGDIHTSEINTIDAALKDRGRLTDERLDISSDQRFDNAGTVRDAAEDLAHEIRDYIDEIETEGLDELDARRFQLTRQLRDVEDRLQTQQQAETVDDYEYLSSQLADYREASEQLEALSTFTRSTLEELRTLHNDIERDRKDVEDLEWQIEQTEEGVDELTATVDSLREQLNDLERREDAVADTQAALEAHRDVRDAATGVERHLTFTRPATIAGLIAAGAAGVVGALADSIPAVGLGAVLLLLSILSGVLYYRATNRLAAAESSRETVLQTARDAGFDVEQVEGVAPRIEAFERELRSTRDRLNRKEQALESREDALANHREARNETVNGIEEQESALREQLSGAGVETIDAYEQQVLRREDLQSDQRTARQSLVDAFGDQPTEDPAEKAAGWEQDLDAMIAEIDVDAVDSATYDERELAQLKANQEELDGRLSDLESQLQDHDDRLDAFERQARGLETQPFIGESVTPGSRTKEGLEALAADLDRVVSRIENDADISRKGLEIFEEIKHQEEQKLTDLFDPDGPASRTFEQLTDGRYAEVEYDPDNHELIVRRSDGRAFSPELLSQGTRDQLYFATRISLAHQLLGTEPGFFLLDDPLLAADPDRLRKGFQTLQELADDGWQIFYLTAKPEVHRAMVDEFDLEHTELDPLASG